MQILLVEDSKNIAEVIFDYFELKGHEMDYAATGPQGFHLIQQNRYDCIILDIMLPGMDGLTLCSTIREMGNDIPIVMLTARDTNQDMLKGLKIGADDYIVKPFDLELLEARVEAVLRRSSGLGFKTTLSVGEVCIDLNSHQVMREGKEIKVTPSGFKILKLLMEKFPGSVAREEIEDHLWPAQQPDQDVLRKHVYQLRNQLDKPFNKKLIHTIPKVGYRLEK